MGLFSLWKFKPLLEDHKKWDCLRTFLAFPSEFAYRLGFSFSQEVAIYRGLNDSFEMVDGVSIHWPGPDGKPPPDKPECGFDNPLCNSK